MEILELKNTVTEIKNSKDGLNRRWYPIEGKIHEPVARSKESLQTRVQKEKRERENTEKSRSNLWDLGGKI